MRALRAQQVARAAAPSPGLNFLSRRRELTAKLKAALDEAEDKKAGKPNKKPTPVHLVHLWSLSPRDLGALQIQGYPGIMQASGKNIQKVMELLGESNPEVQASGAKQDLANYMLTYTKLKEINAASTEWTAEGLESAQLQVDTALEESKPASWPASCDMNEGPHNQFTLASRSAREQKPSLTNCLIHKFPNPWPWTGVYLSKGGPGCDHSCPRTGSG